MQSFKFRLARVQDLRAIQLKTEEAKLEKLFAHRTAMQAEMDALETSLQQAAAAAVQGQYVRAMDMIALERYRQRVEREKKEWLARLAAHDRLIEQQKAQIVLARSKLKLLEKLREKRLADWKAESDRELQALAEEFSAAQWARSTG